MHGAEDTVSAPAGHHPAARPLGRPGGSAPPLDEYARAADTAARTLLGMFNALVDLVEKNLDPDLIRDRLESGFTDSAAPDGSGNP